MDAQTQVTPPLTPPAVDALMEKLQKDCGQSATITLLSDGFSHAKTEQKFKIVLVGKSQDLIGLVSSPLGVQILHVAAKRSGKNVRTTISLKTSSAAAIHPQTVIS